MCTTVFVSYTLLAPIFCFFPRIKRNLRCAHNVSWNNSRQTGFMIVHFSNLSDAPALSDQSCCLGKVGQLISASVRVPLIAPLECVRRKTSAIGWDEGCYRNSPLFVLPFREKLGSLPITWEGRGRGEIFTVSCDSNAAIWRCAVEIWPICNLYKISVGFLFI